MFLTWRLAGSLPQEYLLKRECCDTGREFVCMDRILDAAETGPRWLADKCVAQCVMDSLRFGQSSLHLYQLCAWVLMSNHAHLLVEPHASLARIVRAVRSFSGREANLILKRSGLFWQHEGYDHWVRGTDECNRIIRYIENNPVKAGLVRKAADWVWSSAAEKR